MANMYQLAEADIASQARSTAGTLGQTLQSSAANAGTAFNRFVEGDNASNARYTAVQPERKDFWESFGAAPSGPSKDKQDFWDEFASAGEARTSGGLGEKKKPSGIGTSAVKKTAPGPGPAGKKDDDSWGDW